MIRTLSRHLPLSPASQVACHARHPAVIPSPRFFNSTSSSRRPRPLRHVHRRQDVSDDLVRSKRQAEAVSGEIPSTPVGPTIGFGGFGGGGASSIRDAVLTTIFGVAFLFGGGVVYMMWYKENVLWKMEKAFAPGYDPALDLANVSIKRQRHVDEDPSLIGDELDWDADGPWTEHLRRQEQDLIDHVIHGKEVGHYFMLLGPKGTGKTTMIIDAMQAIQADGVAMCDAHPDLEVFRLRLGKALNYEFNEDTQTGLFQRRDPREAGPVLDIERALNKLEKVALRQAQKKGKPLILVINNIHFFKHDDEGENVLLQFQQRAEAWAASGILTMVFSSDDAWPFFVMRKNASRMHVVSVYDLPAKDAFTAAIRMRKKAQGAKATSSAFRDAVGLVGGRLTYLNRVMRATDMDQYARQMLAVEKGWLLSQIGLIPDCDDDVMDEQKWSSCSWLLLQEFVKKRRAQEAEVKERIDRGEATEDDLANLPLPKISYYESRQIMTRADFMDELDRKNIISIDINHDVTPDSMLTLHAAEEVVEAEGFQELLDNVRDRIDEIESLHRTRELTFKDLDKGDSVRLAVDKTGSTRLD